MIQDLQRGGRRQCSRWCAPGSAGAAPTALTKASMPLGKRYAISDWMLAQDRITARNRYVDSELRPCRACRLEAKTGPGVQAYCNPAATGSTKTNTSLADRRVAGVCRAYNGATVRRVTHARTASVSIECPGFIGLARWFLLDSADPATDLTSLGQSWLADLAPIIKVGPIEYA
jgi:hypothetical protein